MTRSKAATAQAKARAERSAREIARSQVRPQPKAKKDAPTRADLAAKNDRERNNKARADRTTRSEQRANTADARQDVLKSKTAKAAKDRQDDRKEAARDLRRQRDVTANARERALERLRDPNRRVRNREIVDRRPKTDTAEERKRRTARAEVRQKVAKERKRQVARRQERNRDRVQEFRANRDRRVAVLNQRRRAYWDAVRTRQARNEYVNNYREDVRDYWEDRAEDIRDRLEDRRDHLFDDHWWERRHWRHRPILVSNPWWWWRPARWSTVNVFLDAGWSEPIAYDYGTDVIYDESVVYVRGEPVGTPIEYSREVIELANPDVEVVAEAPVVESEWTPLGVWALVQENQGDAVMFFQLSVNKVGLISGAYVNVVSGEEMPVVGQVDRATQRAAWHIGDQTEKVFEAGMTNLTEKQASCLVHVGLGEMQQWLLVRMENPELPDQPATISSSSEPEPAIVSNP